MSEKIVSLEEGEVIIVLTEGRLAVNIELKNGRMVVLAMKEDEDGNWHRLGDIVAEEKANEKAELLAELDHLARSIRFIEE